MAKKPASKAKGSVNEIDDEDPADTGKVTNKLFDQWEGRIELKKNGTDKRGRDTYERKFVPLVCQRKNVKITQAEADALNFSAQQSPRMDFVIAYLPAGKSKTGDKVILVDEVGDTEGEE